MPNAALNGSRTTQRTWRRRVTSPYRGGRLHPVSRACPQLQRPRQRKHLRRVQRQAQRLDLLGELRPALHADGAKRRDRDRHRDRQRPMRALLHDAAWLRWRRRRAPAPGAARRRPGGGGRPGSSAGGGGCRADAAPLCAPRAGSFPDADDPHADAVRHLDDADPYASPQARSNHRPQRRSCCRPSQRRTSPGGRGCRHRPTAPTASPTVTPAPTEPPPARQQAVVGGGFTVRTYRCAARPGRVDRPGGICLLPPAAA